MSLALSPAPAGENTRLAFDAPRRHGTAAAPRVDDERVRAANYPISRWWLRPLASRTAAALAPTRLRPWQITLLGLGAAVAAGAFIAAGTWWRGAAVAALIGYWFCDRTDGLLARRQGTASRWGAWLDANVDELVDLGLHALAIALAVHRLHEVWPLWALVGFMSGKFLLLHGIWSDPASQQLHNGLRGPATAGWLRRLYHFPANADVRLHGFALAIACDAVAIECAVLAAYYHARAAIRYALVARRWGEFSQ